MIVTVQTFPLMSLSERLRASGMPAIKADTWSRFIQEAVALVYQAADELKSTKTWSEFCQKRGALSTPKTRSKKVGVIQIPIEDAITTELGHIVRRLRRQLPASHMLRAHEAAFEVEHQIEDSHRTGRNSKVTDFFFYSQVGDGAPEIAIEAKPLASKGDIDGRYLAAEGMGCFFTTDSPYSRAPVAGMLAYTIDVGAGSYKADINKALGIYVPTPLHVCDVGFDFGAHVSPITYSHHDRVALNLIPVSMLHFEMIFAPVVLGPAAA
ncbi:hypothetical protein ACO34A_01595 [Rhizobium sp. ACO-34A]|nr:hypothetical protein [Rhizobium sp. ACO-34A]ATN32503.1 hypothetical protein ACO34A_01595 [Rhizobium sp. ACO-34A]